MSILIFINIIILLLLSAIHFYWVFGGKWGVESSIPDKLKTIYFNPKNEKRNQIATIIVAFGLIAVATIIGLNHITSYRYWTIIGTRIIGIIFIVRAIGDFNMFGIFKKKSNSKFAKNDTRLFIPLCLFIGFSSILLTFLE